MGGKGINKRKKKGFHFPKYINCEICGKRLIERRPNGLWYFTFGRVTNFSGEDSLPVEIFIHGSLKIKCLRRDCQHWNVLHYFPMQAKGGQAEPQKQTRNQPARNAIGQGRVG
jgi:hypothetical protein